MLAEALAKLPKKGDMSFPLTRRNTKSGRAKPQWKVFANLHEFAQKHGYLTGVLFEQRKSSGSRFKLLLAGPCPYGTGAIRFYTAPVSAEEAAECSPLG